MKQITIIFLSLILSFGTAFAQKTESGGGKTDKDNTTDNTDNNNTPDKNDNTNGGGSLLNNDIFNFVSLLTGQYHKKLLSKSSKIPIIISAEFTANFGTAIHNNQVIDNTTYSNIIPEARLNFGAYYADLRYDYLSDTKSDVTVKNTDFILGLNLVGGQNFRMYFGGGIMYNNDAQLTDPLVMLGADIGGNNRKIVFTPELFYAYDFNEAEQAYIEYGLRGAYKLLDKGHFAVYADAGGAYRKFGEYDLLAFYGGLEFLIQ